MLCIRLFLLLVPILATADISVGHYNIFEIKDILLRNALAKFIACVHENIEHNNQLQIMEEENNRLRKRITELETFRSLDTSMIDDDDDVGSGVDDQQVLAIY